MNDLSITIYVILELSVVKMEGDIIKSMETSVAKKDVSVQFDYLIPVNGILQYCLIH